MFPSDQLSILAYNRVVKDLGEHSVEGFLTALADRYPVQDQAPPEPTMPLNLNSDETTTIMLSGPTEVGLMAITGSSDGETIMPILYWQFI